MEIKEIKIEKIKADPNQPRKVFNREAVQELADSIKTTGIINPIEVDEKNTIVTGEIRYRAAKLAGLKTVPCKVISITKGDRLLRQVIENMHQYDMTPWDVGMALKSIRAGRELAHGDYTKLAKLIGKSDSFIKEHIALVEELSKPLQKAIRAGKIPSSTAVRVVTRTPEKYKKEVEKKVLRGEFKTRDGALSFVEAIKREQDNPEIVKKLLKQDYSKYDTPQGVDQAVRVISPDERDMFRAALAPSDHLIALLEELNNWLEDNSFKSVPEKMLIQMQLGFAVLNIKDWLAGKEITRSKK